MWSRQPHLPLWAEECLIFLNGIPSWKEGRQVFHSPLKTGNSVEASNPTRLSKDPPSPSKVTTPLRESRGRQKKTKPPLQHLHQHSQHITHRGEKGFFCFQLERKKRGNKSVFMRRPSKIRPSSPAPLPGIKHFSFHPHSLAHNTLNPYRPHEGWRHRVPHAHKHQPQIKQQRGMFTIAAAHSPLLQQCHAAHYWDVGEEVGDEVGEGADRGEREGGGARHRSWEIQSSSRRRSRAEVIYTLITLFQLCFLS